MWAQLLLPGYWFSNFYCTFSCIVQQANKSKMQQTITFSNTQHCTSTLHTIFPESHKQRAGSKRRSWPGVQQEQISEWEEIEVAAFTAITAICY